jgi:hypothetical protein
MEVQLISSKMRFGVLAGFVCSISLAQTQPAPFSLSIRSPEPVKIGSRIYIEITQKNLSRGSVDCFMMDMEYAIDMSMIYEVKDENGIKMKQREPSVGAFKACELAAGESLSRRQMISDIFDFSHPGKYSIQVSRFSPHKSPDNLIKSNVVTLIVLPE